MPEGVFNVGITHVKIRRFKDEKRTASIEQISRFI